MTSIGRFFWLEFHRSPVDWWWLGCLLISGLLLAGLAFWKEQKTLIGAEPYPESHTKEAVEQKEKEAFNNALKEWTNGHNTGEVLKAGVQYLDLFTPLQREALGIAHKIGSYLSELGPCPDSDIPTNTVGGVAQQAMIFHARDAQVNGWYREHLAPSLKSLTNRIAMDGYVDDVLPRFFEGLSVSQNLIWIQKRLWLYVLRVNGIDIKGEL